MYRTTAATPVFSLRREIDRLFDDAFGGPASRNGTVWAPPVDVRESQNELTLALEVPGVSPDQIELTIDNGILTVKGEKREERKEGDEGQYHMLERTYGTFTRSFQLPKSLDESKIEAKHEHGILTIRIPKAALPQPKKIAINGSGSTSSSNEAVSR